MDKAKAITKANAMGKDKAIDMVKEAKAKVKVIVKVEAADEATTETNKYLQTKLNYCQNFYYS